MHATREDIESELDNLLGEFIRIANLCNVSWWLDGGALLGKLRHADYIPWDDDIDIGMLREDFEVMCRSLRERKIEVSPDYEAHFPGSEFPVVFNKDSLKIRSHKFYGFELGLEKLTTLPRFAAYSGLAIDIIPFDTVPRLAPLFTFITKIRRVTVLKRHGLHGSDSTMFQSITRWAAYPLLPMLDFVLEMTKSTPASLRKQMWPSLIGSYPRHAHKLSETLPPEVSTFRGKKVKIPQNASKYLEILYGPRYMELPPLEKRVGHFVELQLIPQEQETKRSQK